MFHLLPLFSLMLWVIFFCSKLFSPSCNVCPRGGWTTVRKASQEQISFCVICSQPLARMDLAHGYIRLPRWSVLLIWREQLYLSALLRLFLLFFVYCVNFTFLRLNGVLAHFSFFFAPGERRVCILPLSEPLLKKLEGIYSPAVVKVTSSIIFEVCSLTVRS